jgi:hypothetical protein
MPTWLHILIATLIPTFILIGGSSFFMLTGQFQFAVLIPIPLAVLMLFVYMKLVPARCPECGGKAYLKRSKEKLFYFECQKCGRVGITECSMDE